MGEVIRHALVRVPEPIEWDGTVETPAIGVVDATDETVQPSPTEANLP